MTQEALARAIGVSLGTVQGWCSGKRMPRWPHLVAAAESLGYAPSWFYADHSYDA